MAYVSISWPWDAGPGITPYRLEVTGPPPALTRISIYNIIITGSVRGLYESDTFVVFRFNVNPSHTPRLRNLNMWNLDFHCRGYQRPNARITATIFHSNGQRIQIANDQPPQYISFQGRNAHPRSPNTTIEGLIRATRQLTAAAPP